jgi:hypothetical protein
MKNITPEGTKKKTGNKERSVSGYLIEPKMISLFEFVGLVKKVDEFLGFFL